MRISRSTPFLLLIVFALLSFVLPSCEDEASKGDDRKAAKSEAPAKAVDLETVDLPKLYETLETTFLNAYASRELALADVCEKLFDVERPAATVQYFDALCAAKVEGGCTDLDPEQRYFMVFATALKTMKQAAELQGKNDLSAKFEGIVGFIGSLSEQKVSGVAIGGEPLLNLVADPTLVLGATDLKVTVGMFATRSFPLPDPEAETSELGAYCDAMLAGETFEAAGLVRPPGASKAPSGGKKLQLMIPAETKLESLQAVLDVAYAHKMQAVDLVVRSKEYKTLGAIPMNLVKASILGSDQSIEVGSEAVIWRDSEADETKSVSWDGIARISEIVKQPLGQLILYIEIDPSLNGQQLADVLSAIRTRCGEQELCQNLQMAIALKSTKKQ
ncbi:MAG: hypothetical protein AUK47_04400 [Deltaproteobacteria bacterium CG2_30_63_29]|nr:MAG: hypothetical protein AUK47_04400 [Deltaproteobacteria bacterium CG2_30_63_29]PIV99633.1 MAG: hypothetical protein COW42_10405 [Deltaproteobacteria bacterium CG17_big_fil_post_rev_8_21_14_2_50_63_7]